jgi:threonine dehydratase
MTRLDTYRATAVRIQPHVRRTPVFDAHPVRIAGMGERVGFKAEFLQVSGSFKARGAFNRILAAGPQALCGGVVTASGGNFGAAVAHAARALSTRATIFVMTSAPVMSRQRISAAGAELVIEGDFWDQSWAAAQRYAEETGKLLLHPFGHDDVIVGAGSIGLEILEDMPDVGTIVVSIGGGGLVAGIAEAVKQVRPDVVVIGAEASGCPTLTAALSHGGPVRIERIETCVPILAAVTTTQMNYDLIRRHVDQIIAVPEDRIKPAAQRIWRDFGAAIEMGAATAAATLYDCMFTPAAGRPVCVVLCGSGADGLPTPPPETK